VDTFHMNIEERSISGAILAHGNLLNHVHLSDSNRLAPGLGHIDFAEVLQALVEVGYERSLAFELIPTLPNLLESRQDSPSLDDVADQALQHMDQVEQMLAAGRLEPS
jgi:sugar phosphate isomerase/epimerase